MEYLSQYRIPTRSYKYPYDAVVCTRTQDQYLLEFHNSLNETHELFSLLPGDLELKARTSEGKESRLKVDELRAEINDLNKHEHPYDVLAVRTQIKPGDYYQYEPDKRKLVRAWIDELLKVATVEWDDFGAQVIKESVFSGIDESFEASYLITGRDTKKVDHEYNAKVEIDFQYKLRQITTNLPPRESWVWSNSRENLFYGQPPRKAIEMLL